MSRYVLLAALCLLTGPDSALPNSVRLDKIRHEPQGPNNCGPITALTVLGSYGTRVTAGHPGAGSPDLLRRLLARGIPVVVQQRLQPGSNVAHFRTVYGDQGGAS
ncbi:hypothetical protein Dgeo_2527 (plasmid) [Deinococcus geothermalis DSM 11300]|uniref:Peptidase C39-like domain-containing protein n=1 Tax=Deinococcus geothermalis (strain DSM 11300 / CIP 105573 / AG-3a) TaxID=319795 RepID=Q1J3H3_DEIGD|nr:MULTISPECIES: hypothetical protein [Deinococcus]ABF43961.1 hypothetical protein Dgeo_2527 [Deinococcus geothermalis DSM 11300]TDE85474.1 hypothetical protein E0686_11335 [Deinococcus sp. S9]